MLTEIPTEFEAVDGPHDDGVERVIRATENFVHHGEQIERTTEFHFLEDGGVHLVQRLENQGVIDTMTLNAAVAYRLMDELDRGDVVDVASEHEFDVGKELEKADSSMWKITNRMVDVDTGETLYRLRESDVGPSNYTETLTESQIERSFRTGSDAEDDDGE